MSNQRIQFTEWLPDQPANAGSLNDAKNVFPVGIGYGAFPSAEHYSNAASETLNSVFVAKYGANVQVFAGGATKLFKMDNTTLNLADVSKAGGYGGDSTWKFEQFGQVVLASNNSEKIQAWTIGTSTAFADVAAAAPIAKDIATVRDFVFAGNLAGGTDANKVQWTDINDETDWTSGSTSQSDYQIIPDGGNVQAITGGEFGVVFLEKTLVRASYVGSPLFFQFDTISSGLGCLEGNSVAQYGALSFFLSDDGWYSTDGQAVNGIGTEKIDRWFFDDADLTQIGTISAAVDPVKNLVVWNYANTQGTRSILIYNWQLQKWSRADTVSDVVGTIATTGTTLEAITTNVVATAITSGKSYTIVSLNDGIGGATTDFTAIGASANTVGLTFTSTGVGAGTGTATDMVAAVAASTTLDTLVASLDSRLFIGGKFLFAGTRVDRIAVFTGTSITPQLITTDVEVGYNSVATLARPQIDNGTANVAVASRRELDDIIEFSAYVPATSEGRCSLRSAGRYHRFSVQPTGNWTTAMAVDVELKPQGNR
tara:strand:- start:1417 stop:3036 length:1620 start_codon:yes stop_codon:yes gene_type:complete